MRKAATASAIIFGLVLVFYGCSGSDNSPTSTDPPDTTTTTTAAGSSGSLRFLFIHHSVGEGFLFDGGMWEMLEALGLEVHDRTYGDGWVGENTDPDHFPITFAEHYEDMMTWELPTAKLIGPSQSISRSG